MIRLLIIPNLLAQSTVDLTVIEERLLHIWAILLAMFILGVLWLGYRIYHK